jgi:hypothetical protein
MKIPLSLVKPILTISSLVAVASITLETKPAAAACLSQPCVTVEVEGIKYDVSYKTGFFGDLESELSNQVWWGNPNLTSSFAQSVGLLLGTSDIGSAIWNYFPDHALRSGPIFAYESGFGMSAWEGQTWMDVWKMIEGIEVYERVTLDWEYLGVYDYQFPTYQAYQPPYAVASPSAVPEPLTVFGSILGLGVLGAVKRKRKQQWKA